MWLVLNHPKMVNFQVSYTSIPELCKSIQIRLHLWASGRLWGLLVHSSVKAGVWGSCCKLTSACPFIILHNASRVFARTCAPPLPGFGVFACCLKAGVLQNLSTEQVVRVLLCWCCKLCVAWMLEMKRRGFASKDSCIRPGSSCSHIPVLWGGSGSGELTVTCRSQIGNRCPAMVTAAATTFKFLRFSAISFPLTSYQTAAMFISSRVIFQWKRRGGEGAMTPASCHSLSLPGDSVSAVRAFGRWTGSSDSRLCLQKITSFLPSEEQLEGRALLPDQGFGRGAQSPHRPWALQVSIMPLSPRGSLLSEGTCLLLLLFFKEDFSEHQVMY